LKSLIKVLRRSLFDRPLDGFTLVEILVAMVVLAVGLLGMAAMTILVMKGSRGASDLTSATNICQLKMEELKDVQWNLLGSNAAGDAARVTYGVMGGGIVLQSELNSQGRTKDDILTQYSGVTEPDLTNTVTALGPYKFTRSFVICKGVDYSGTPGAATPPSYSDQYVTASTNEPRNAPDCRVEEQNNSPSNSTRVESLACKSEDITGAPGSENLEKKIKVLCSWRARDGQCHSVHMDTTVVQLQ
jgi:prepilin-type N-terminal cleavage/methylation domain-containing protein